jgi:hypothetical protein
MAIRDLWNMNVRYGAPLAEAARAHKEILEPGSAGKIVLTI